MTCTQTRPETLKNLRTKITNGEAIIGGGAGTGISAKREKAGGIDLIVIYNSGRCHATTLKTNLTMVMQHMHSLFQMHSLTGTFVLILLNFCTINN